MMQRFSKWERRGKQCVLLYCGDHDPGGLHISEELRSNLAALTRAVGYDPASLIIERCGLNYDFIEANGLTWIDNLETGSGGRLDDPQHRDHYRPYVQDYPKRFGVRKVEANALVTRPSEGRQLCRQAILKYVNERDLDDYGQKVAAAREELRLAVRRLMDGGRGL
jgi:hypothetical protein